MKDLHKQLTTSKIPKSPYKKKNRRTADEISKEYLVFPLLIFETFNFLIKVLKFEI